MPIPSPPIPHPPSATAIPPSAIPHEQLSYLLSHRLTCPVPPGADCTECWILQNMEKWLLKRFGKPTGRSTRTKV